MQAVQVGQDLAIYQNLGNFSLMGGGKKIKSYKAIPTVPRTQKTIKRSRCLGTNMVVIHLALSFNTAK